MSSAMMFEESSMGGSSMLNTSMKSEGGASAHNTSRGEEAVEVGGGRVVMLVPWVEVMLVSRTAGRGRR